MQLSEFSSTIALLRGVRPKQRQCGLREAPPNWWWYEFDGVMLESVLFLFLPVGTMIFFFYVPMSEYSAIRTWAQRAFGANPL